VTGGFLTWQLRDQWSPVSRCTILRRSDPSRTRYNEGLRATQMERWRKSCRDLRSGQRETPDPTWF
jgi:hypothetical protein